MKIGAMSKCVFRSECGKLVGTMHGDDVLMAGPRSVIEKPRSSLRKRYETREQMISGRIGEPKELVILNRKVQWAKEGIRLAPDQRHAVEVIEELGLSGSKPVDMPVCVTTRDMTEDERAPLGGVEASQFRRLAAKLNYLSLDRPDIRYGKSLVCAAASQPRLGDMTRLKRIARFLVGKPLLWTYFRWGVSGSRLYAFTDADWPRARRVGGRLVGACLCTTVHSCAFGRGNRRSCRFRVGRVNSTLESRPVSKRSVYRAGWLTSDLNAASHSCRTTRALWTTQPARGSAWRSMSTPDTCGCRRLGSLASSTCAKCTPLGMSPTCSPRHSRSVPSGTCAEG